MSRPTVTSLLGGQPPRIVAHRGHSSQAPENTLAAFRSALESGADAVELDYHHSADGVPIVIHDDDLARTTDITANRPVADVDAAELAELDAGSWFHQSFAGERLPTLEAALRLILPHRPVLIERKAGDPETCLALLEQLQATFHVIVQSFDWTFLEAFRAMNRQVAFAALGEGELTEQRLQWAAQLQPALLIWRHRDLDTAAIARVQRYGLRLWTFTVNDVERARSLVAMGVSGLITDAPSTLVSAFR